ncbi:fam-l protein [Plasmodium malariae]|uniref:Fam-l protein n=1 Tax=Plasmodium malariae TaxID=5858 RepID=A0A1D3JH58_PLAMA|nr:fam-l protein [Plasmodium malariae]SBT85662.1 fam-l protein [Plasmodium malariae]
MEQKITSMLFKKISTFILLSWICHIYIYTRTYNKFLDECNNHRRKLYTRNCRLMAKYNQDKNSSVVCLKEETTNSANYEKDICNNVKCASVKKNQSNGCLQRNARGQKMYMKNKACVFETKKYSHLEKKIFKELDYEDFLKKNRTISDRIYRKIMRKKCGLRLALPLLLFLVLSISFILDNFCRCGLTYGLFNIIILISPGSSPGPSIRETQLSSAINSFYDLLNKPPLKWFTKVLRRGKDGKLENYCVKGFLGFLIYFVPLFILGTILISAVFYYHKKVKKYENIKFRKK